MNLNFEQQNELYEMLCDMEGYKVAELFTDWHGFQILDMEFAKFVVEETGIDLPWTEEEEEEEEEEVND